MLLRHTAWKQQPAAFYSEDFNTLAFNNKTTTKTFKYILFNYFIKKKIGQMKKRTPYVSIWVKNLIKLINLWLMFIFLPAQFQALVILKTVCQFSFFNIKAQVLWNSKRPCCFTRLILVSFLLFSFIFQPTGSFFSICSSYYY